MTGQPADGGVELLQAAPNPKQPGQRRLLALDGGGIRGVLTLEILGEIEAMLRRELDDPDLVLADYFDYFGGTSTGAMIAAGLALGWPVQRALDLYTERGHEMFRTAPLHRRVTSLFGYKFSSSNIAATMRDEYGPDVVLGDARFKALLLAVMHNVNTDSPWPLSNNPAARYNDTSRPDCNLRLPLWEVIRASAAAPLIYPPEPVTLGDREFVFVDGALTPYNNPAFQLFLHATEPAYRLDWETGADKLLLVSVGTGLTNEPRPELTARDMHGLHTLRTVHGTLMSGSVMQQDLLCRIFGDCRHGAEIDRELGDLVASSATHDLFTYVRYNAGLNEQGLAELDLAALAGAQRLAGIRKVASMDHIDDLRAIGRAAAARQVSSDTFSGFLA